MKPYGAYTDFSPFVSAIIPLFNGSRYIEACLRSILAQTYSNYEIIVIDDGSTDDGLEKVKNLSILFPGRFRIYSHPDGQNHGIAASRNLGIRNATGEYIAFLDQDDVWLANKLSRQIDALREYPDIVFLYAKTFFIDEDGRSTLSDNTYSMAGKGWGEEPKNVFFRMLNENFVPTLTVLVKKKCIEEHDYFDEGPRHEYEDWLLWSKIAFTEKFLFISEALSKYRLHGNNFSFYRFKTGLEIGAEEHYLVSLLKYLKDKRKINDKILNRIFRLCLFRLFLRARSWGMSKKDLEIYKVNFLKRFPNQAGDINTTYWIAVMLPPGILSLIRKLRRNIIRM